MSKTELTKEIERALFARTAKTIGAYGALEVTIGHISGVKGYDRCDYVEFTTNGEFTCYEIKVTLKDYLNGRTKITHAGNKNYVVAPWDLAYQIKNKVGNFNLDKWDFEAFGLVAYDNDGSHLANGTKFKVLRRASHQTLGVGERTELLEACAKSASRDAIKYHQMKEK